MQTAEAKMIKGMLGINTRTKNTNLLRAIGLDTMEERYAKIKCSFAISCNENPATRLLLTNKDDGHRVPTDNTLLAAIKETFINWNNGSLVNYGDAAMLSAEPNRRTP
jgi:hypothetical protein